MLTQLIEAIEKAEHPYLIRIEGVTFKEFQRLTDEDTKAELIDGVMIVHSPAVWEHNDLTEFIGDLMGWYAEEKDLGKTTMQNTLFHVSTKRRVAPDVAFVRKERVPLPLPDEFEGVPDIIVETLSRGTRRYDLHDKRSIYHQVGVPEIWFVDRKNKRIIIDRKRGRQYVEEVVTKGKVASQVLSGFWIDVSWLWRKQLPKKMDCLRKILGQ